MYLHRFMLFACLCAPVLLHAQHAPMSTAAIQSLLDNTRHTLPGEKHTTGGIALWYDYRNFDKVTWMYGEVKVPTGESPANTYYCLMQGNGWYTGIQQKPRGERQVIFSVWDAKDGKDNPEKVDTSDQATLLKAGGDVLYKRFGGEGSGAQTRWLFNWQPEQTYKFLAHISPDTVANVNVITMFFNDGKSWKLIAKIRRPHISDYPKAAASFMEDWSTTDDRHRRAAYYKQLWVGNTAGKWFPAKEAIISIEHEKKLHNYGAVACTDGGFFVVMGAGFTDFYTEKPATLPQLNVQQPEINLKALLAMENM